jgi:hypothetical protein
MDYFNFPKLLIDYSQVNWDIYYYFPTEMLRTHFHNQDMFSNNDESSPTLQPDFVTQENCMKDILTKSFTPEQCMYLSGDVFSLGMFFIQILTSSNIYPPQYF